MTELTRYEKDRLRYLEYHEGYPENKGGLTDSERVELFNLREDPKIEDKMSLTKEQSETIIEGLTVAIDALESVALESNVKQSAIERFKRVRLSVHTMNSLAIRENVNKTE